MRTIKELIYVLKMYGLPCHGEEKSIMQEAAEALEMLQQELQDERHRHDRYVDFELAQAEELRKLKEQTRWIPVTERFPDPGVRVLASDGGFVGEFYINKRGQWQRYNVNDSSLLMALDILYWKPLPEPPKEG